VSRFALIGLAAAGCFYTDPINQRPSLDIKQAEPTLAYRGGTVSLEAVSNDPDGHDVFYTWRAYACTTEADCDQAPYYLSKETKIDMPVASARVDIVTSPVQLIHVWLEGIDSFGATAKPPQQLWISLDDHAPTVDLYTASSYESVVNTPFSIFASIGDPDDDYTKATVSWEVFTPTNNPSYTLVDFAADQNVPMHIVYGKTFTPAGIGEYEIRVTADDGLGVPSSTASKSIKINVGVDKPPCLSQLTPLVATAPSAWPMSEPTLFQVHVVTDDLDPYPTVNDSILGPTKFTWSLLAPGSSRQVLSGVSGNSVALDPASYQLGDIVELRVEIADRNNTPITCADANATCAVDATAPSCIQRQTWRVEVR
jgi:hypothetical protein